ncbi:Fic family protein [Romeria aff. gracilis LEGE 07310]|uniref:Fic family protein n=1 Tax=Vasconcelosia minhoensis LEGE 07310 TaxID=915328 RepID=A0A8J7A7C4_9CYAN|nr:Fic family protein [Romeria gracilis]MBE9077425.1 Fic family protein [Romeria aff. gracilis LEGE 07310]
MGSTVRPKLCQNDSAAELYDALLRQLKAHPRWRIDSVVAQMLSAEMTMPADLAQIDQMKGWLDSFRPLSPAVLAELKQRYDVRFTYNSNAIEGNTLTQSETELVLSKGITIGGKTLAEHLEVIGHKEAIDYIETLAQVETSIGEWEIRQIHSLVIRKISPMEAGRYRQLDVKAAGTNYVYPPHYQLPELMAEFVQWLAAAPESLHPIEYAAEAHYRFVSIHPFRDGNGRTGRLLMNLLLIRASFPIVVIPNQRRQDYIGALVKAQRSENDLSSLLDLVLEAARGSLIETLSVVATAADSRGKGLPFYRKIVAFLEAEKLIED